MRSVARVITRARAPRDLFGVYFLGVACVRNRRPSVGRHLFFRFFLFLFSWLGVRVRKWYVIGTVYGVRYLEI